MCGVAVANKTIKAALSLSLATAARVLLIAAPHVGMRACYPCERRCAQLLCVRAQAVAGGLAWQARSRERANTGALSATLMVGCAWWMLGMKRCPRERRWVRLLRACAPPSAGNPQLASKHLPSPASRERAAAGGGRAFASFASGKEQRISLSIA